jgi:hypothetical protein
LRDVTVWPLDGGQGPVVERKLPFARDGGDTYAVARAANDRNEIAMSTSFYKFIKYVEHGPVHATRTSLTALLMLAACAPLLGQTNIECSSIGGNWCLRLSEKEHKLEFSTDPGWTEALESDSGRLRNNYYRNMPTLELSNMGAAGAADIVRFEMTIGDTRFHFEDAEMGIAAALGYYTPGYELTSSISPDGNLLTVDIAKAEGGGLAPGETVHFRIDLDVDAGFTGAPFYQFPDFRTVLFDMNGEQHYGPDPAFPPPAEDNAQITVRFSDGATSGPKPLADYVVTGPQRDFVNENTHPLFAADGVDLFAVSGSAGVIPEPGAQTSVIIGLLGGLFPRTFARRRTAKE